MKKILLGCFLLSIPVLSEAIAARGDVRRVYSGSTLKDFEAQDIQLKKAMNESGWGIFWSWVRHPSAQQLAVMRNNVSILQERLAIIENTRDDVLKKLPTVSPSPRSTTNDVLYFLTSLVYLPGMLWREMFTQNPQAAQQKKVNQLNDVYARVNERIKSLKRILNAYNAG